MAYTITHNKVSSGTVNPLVEVDLRDWNEDHVIAGSVAASEITGAAALTRTNDTNVTLTLGGDPATALLKATSITVGWSGTLAASRGGFGANVSASSGVPLFATGTPTFTGTSGTGNFVRVTSPALVTPALGAATATSLTTAGGTISNLGTSSIARFIVSASNNVGKLFSWRTANVERWAARVDGDETGSEAGGDWALRRYDDSGAFVDEVLHFFRSSGVGTMKSLSVTENISQTGSILSIGPAGTAAATNAKVVLEASSGSNAGASVQFKRNSVNLFQFGNSSGILGGSSDDFVIYSNVAGAGVVSAFHIASSSGNPGILNGLAAPAGGSTSARLLFGSTAGFGIYYGSGAPSVSAGQGSIYLRSDGSSTSTRLYVNTTGSTTWTNVTTAA